FDTLGTFRDIFQDKVIKVSRESMLTQKCIKPYVINNEQAHFSSSIRIYLNGDDLIYLSKNSRQAVAVSTASSNISFNNTNRILEQTKQEKEKN
ncbi:33854_t:CDS:2, partial [Gigaspora margarita]